MNTLAIFDIETEPADAAFLKAFEPEFEAPGNLKDPEKIAAAIAAKRAKWIEDAALSPITGRILAIGFRRESSVYWHEAAEADLIREFFRAVSESAMGAEYKLCGFSIHGFDLPFICRRALVHGIPIPQGLMPNGHARFYWPSWMIDLRAIWGFGELQPHGSLDVVCRLLGLGGKTGEGRDFARLYHGSFEERKQALAYLENDLELTAKLAARLGVA